MTTASPPPGTADHAKTMPAAGRAPVATPGVGYVGAVLALLLVAAGVVALRDTAVALGWLGGPPWIDTAIDWIDGLRFQTWMIPAGIAAVLAGLGMLLSALTPRRTRVIAVAARSAVWIDPTDLARVASHAASAVPGVLDARSTATRRKIVVTADVVDPNDPSIPTAVDVAVRDVTEILAAAPKIIVRTRTGEALR